MRRCALYARYSSDLQRESSIEDQIRRCRDYARVQGWLVVEELVVADRAVSGEAVAGRTGLARIMEAAQKKPRPIDCVLVEDMSRWARDLSDSLRTTALLDFHGVAVVSVTQGIDSSQSNARQLLTLHGMVDEQYLVGLRDKVHRGQHGRVLNGMIPGGRCYGYKNIPVEDPSRMGKYGRQAVQGVRQRVDEGEADVIRRIFQMYAEGTGLAQIAKRLNQEGVSSPQPARNRIHRAWSRYTIREMLHNERYRGVLVWDRTKKVRNPSTGKKVSRARPSSEWTRVEVAELRIVPEELWQAAHQRNAQVNVLGIARLGGLCRTQKSKTYLFSGLLECGRCGSSMVIVSGGGRRGYVKYGCHAHKHNGVCENNWTIRRDRLEEQLLGEIERKVLDPGMIDYLIARCQEELQRRLKETEFQTARSKPEELRQRRHDLQGQAARLAEVIGMGGDLPSLMHRLRDVESEIKRLDQVVAQSQPTNLKMPVHQVREHVLRSMIQLRDALTAGTEVAIARNALRKHVGRLILSPAVKDGRKLFRVSGSVDPVPEVAEGGMLLVARDGIEPPTPAFSVLRTFHLRMV